MKPFAEWTYRDAVEAIEARKRERVGEDFAANRAIAEEHDFWQDGATWVGPRGTADAWAVALRDAIRQQHVPGAASLEALGNFVRGLFGKEANIQAVPRTPLLEGSDDERKAKKDAAELVAMLSEWWDAVGLWAHIRQAGMRSRWATWGTLRLWIPDGHLVRQEATEGKPESLTLPRFTRFSQALDAVELSAPEPEHCIVILHPSTQERAAAFHFRENVGGVEGGRVELWYQVGERTALRVLRDNDDPLGPYLYDWSARLPVSEMEGELLLTEPVRRQEAALSFAETNVVKVGESSGFRERYTMNAEPHGLWLPTPPDGPTRTTTDANGQTLYLHMLPRSLGPAVTTDLVGIVASTDDHRGETRAMPGIHIADPVDPDFATKGAEYRRARVLQLCGQGHLAMTSGAESSGFAYEQARAAFRGDLEWHKSPAERAIAQLLEALVTMAESMTSEQTRWLDRFRIVVTLTVDPGPVSPELMRETYAAVEKGLLSRASAMARLGVEDVAAELEAIDQDPAAAIGRWKAAADVVTTLLREDALSVETAVRILGQAGLPIEDVKEEIQRIREQRRPPIGALGSGLGNEGIRIPGIDQPTTEDTA